MAKDVSNDPAGLCEVPICAATPHTLMDVLWVWCDHTGGCTAYVTLHSDQGEVRVRVVRHFGPFDTVADAITDVVREIRSITATHL